MNVDLGLVSAFLLGLSSAPHCLLMCGGIVTALNTQSTQMSCSKTVMWQRNVLFQLGRIAAYTVLGLILFVLGSIFQFPKHIAMWARGITALALLLAAFHHLGWFSGFVFLESKAMPVWTKISQRFTFAGLNSKANAELHPLQIGKGFVWGLIPCAMVYAALINAMSASSFTQAGVLMLMFGLGTFPAVFAVGQVGVAIKQWFSPKISALLLIVFALLSFQMLFNSIEVHQHGHHQSIERRH